MCISVIYVKVIFYYQNSGLKNSRNRSIMTDTGCFILAEGYNMTVFDTAKTKT